jgi:CubicO group peptidase (beta-lactamase class C family)
MGKLIPILLFLISASFTTSAQTWQDTINKIETIFSRYQPDHPGCMLSISRNGQLIYSKAWGMADLERKVPLTTSSITEAGSVSKQFTAASILLLEQQGKLSIADDVRKYIPELPDYGSPIPLFYLLHHASGIRDWGSVAAIAGWPRGTKSYTNDDALDIMIHQKALNHAPNEEFLYSNSNYSLLTIIVQRVSGMSLADFTRKYIFEPAGMTHTQWRDNYKRIVPGRAIAYSKNRDGSYEINMPNENAYGHGGLLTTTEDLLKWSEFFGSGKLGGAAFLRKQLATVNLNNGKPNIYGAGLFIGKLWGYDWVRHDGATAGYRAFLESFPQLHLSIALLSNTAEFNVAEFIQPLNTLFVPDREHLIVGPSSVVGGDEFMYRHHIHKLAAFTGYYYSEETQSGFTVTVKDDQLWMVRSTGRTGKLLLNGDEYCDTQAEMFDGDNAKIKFIWEKDTLTGLTISVSRARNVFFTRQTSTASPAQPSPNPLK